MIQHFIYISEEYLDDMVSCIQEHILFENELGFYLADIQYSGLEEGSEGWAHAYLLFNEVENGKEVDSRSDTSSWRTKKNSRCKERREDSCC
jgi:hypothetical protein